MTVFSSNSDSYFAKGIIHSFQFYDRALSEAELLQNFYAGSGAAALNVEPTPLSIIVTITDAGASSYKLTYTPDGGSETTAVPSTTELLHTIVNLQPETNYTVSVYLDDVFEESVSTTTLANSAANYEPTDFDDGSGGFDISSFDSTARALFSEIMNDVFTTGDDVTLSLNSGQTVSAKFVKRGESVSIENTDAVVMPFDASAGALQTVDLTLTDTSTEAVDYNESTETITINTVEYSEGDVLIIDGKKVVVSSS